MNKSIANRLNIVIEPQLPQLYINDSFYQLQTEHHYKEKRQDSQTSQQVNILDELNCDDDEIVEPVDLHDGDIQTLMFSGDAVNKIIEMLKRSNRVQKNKGDIAETVSFAFTCFKGPDDKYIRNFITNGTETTIVDFYGDEYIINYRSIGFCVIYSLIIGKQMSIEDYKKFQETEYYKALQPENDFIKSKYSISSNVPAVDNSVLSIFVEPQKLLLVVRQDKIGYTMQQILDMCITGVHRIAQTIIKSEFFDNFNEICVIYTLAWNPDKNKNKKSVPMQLNLIKQLLMKIKYEAEQILTQERYKKIQGKLYISYFVENCLGEQVINDSISIYKELEQQHQGFKKIYENLQKLLKNKEFKKLCDTNDYQLLLPDKHYSFDEFQKLIKLIPQPLLVNRMLKGLQNLQNIIADNRELQEISVSEQ